MGGMREELVEHQHDLMAKRFYLDRRSVNFQSIENHQQPASQPSSGIPKDQLNIEWFSGLNADRKRSSGRYSGKGSGAKSPLNDQYGSKSSCHQHEHVDALKDRRYDDEEQQKNELKTFFCQTRRNEMRLSRSRDRT